MAERTELLARPQSGDPDPSSWIAVIVKKEFRYADSTNYIKSTKVYDNESEKMVVLRRGEMGVSIASRFNKLANYRERLVHFERHGVPFRLPVPEHHLEFGDRYRPTAAKLAALQALSVETIDDALVQWSRQGSVLDRYVKALWLGIKAQRTKFEAMGIDQETSRRMFDWGFLRPTVDKICRLFRPKFRRAMEVPGQTISGLAEACDKQTSSWPEDRFGVVYVRVYTNLDDEQIGVNNAAAYTGWTIHASKRDKDHRDYAARRAERETDRVSHYDVARTARNVQVLIAFCQIDAETPGVGGTPELKRMAEQTVILMLRSYASWTRSSEMPDLFSQRARLLQNIERQVRVQTGFQPNWRLHGTNVSSPLFEIYHGYQMVVGIGSPALSLYALPPHPTLGGKTVMRATLLLNENGCGGAAAMFHGHRTGRPDSTMLRIQIPKAVTVKIRQAVEATPSKSPFWATLVFELMDGGQEHEHPFFGLPELGPYKHFGAANALGIRVEWKHRSKPQWFSARLQVGFPRQRRVANALLDGDSSKVEDLFQQATAFIHMVRGEECPDAPAGFWRSLTFRRSRPAIQRLQINHLRQAIRWVPQTQTKVAPPVRSTLHENRMHLYGKTAPGKIMTVGKRLPMDDSFWSFDRTSSMSVKKGLRCDTCTILIRRRTQYLVDPPECDYNPETKACSPCRALNRICTFSPMTPLLRGWVGEEVDPEAYVATNRMILFPVYGGGPLRKLVPHFSMSVEDSHKVTEIQEPVGWDSLYPFLVSGEDDELKVGDDAAVEEDGEDAEDDEAFL